MLWAGGLLYSVCQRFFWDQVGCAWSASVGACAPPCVCLNLTTCAVMCRDSVDGQVYRGNMQSNGSVYSFSVHTTVELDPGFYTNLAHVRWYTKSGLLYDMASKWAFKFTPFH
eukprot:35632-Eustigmatos_ZCMA.PRE.1